MQYDVEQLAERGDFNDSAYLLLHGELPSAEQKAAFDRDLTQHSLVHEQLIMCALAHSQLPSATHACGGNRLCERVLVHTLRRVCSNTLHAAQARRPHHAI